MLSQLPCWAELTPEQYRERIAELVDEIEAEARADREAREGSSQDTGASRASWNVVVCLEPAPRFHAASKAAREALRNAYGLFLAAFREAAERLKAGDRMARFPNGCFPPGLPFVHA